jgi:hypothetical protein
MLTAYPLTRKRYEEMLEKIAKMEAENASKEVA